MPTAAPMNEGDIEAMAEVLRVLGHATRLRLVETLLLRGELSVGELESLTGVGQPGLSQQLAILRKAELVNTRRAAKQIYYSLTSEALSATADFIARLRLGQGAAEAHRPATFPRSGSAAMFAKIL